MNAMTEPLARAASPLMAVQGLGKTYRTKAGEDVQALVDIDIALQDGEFVTVLGPSGCGKTTLLKILAGIVAHSSGQVLFQGRPIAEAQKVMGVVFQSPVLLPWRTVLHNVEVLGLDRGTYQRAAEELLQLVGLADFGNKYPSELSGGMQQRASIVRALVHDPGILLMDEPFGALDAMTRERMNVELQRIWLANRKTVFFITHSVGEAVFLSDRVLVMSARPGRLIDEVCIDFPRPRSIDVMSSAAFGEYTRHLRARLGSHEGGHE
jgi:NitT/TauT family transport system ATP-binding protein